jgi:hypothetical protein
MTVRFKEYDCSRSIVGIVGSNPADDIDVLLGLLLYWAGSGLCDEPITYLEQFYRLYMCVYNCVRSRNANNEAA